MVRLKKRIHIPLVADIHFDYRLAIAAMENGADKIRINPGNIGSDERVRAVYLNGSRTNPNAPKDRFQDYDVVYVVTDTKPYYEKHDWINHFWNCSLYANARIHGFAVRKRVYTAGYFRLACYLYRWKSS